MKTVVCYGDSNTWGFKPKAFPPEGAPDRYAYDVRWPGRLQFLLGEEFLVIENGLNGRTTAFDDPMDSRRNGLDYVDTCMLVNMPVDIVIIMLGTNDTKEHLGQNVWSIGAGLERLIQHVNGGGYGVGGGVPEVLVISPAHLCDNISSTWLGEEFGADSVEKSKGLGTRYSVIAQKHGIDRYNEVKAHFESLLFPAIQDKTGRKTENRPFSQGSF